MPFDSVPSAFDALKYAPSLDCNVVTLYDELRARYPLPTTSRTSVVLSESPRLHYCVGGTLFLYNLQVMPLFEMPRVACDFVMYPPSGLIASALYQLHRGRMSKSVAVDAGNLIVTRNDSGEMESAWLALKDALMEYRLTLLHRPVYA
jgi:hypothetical protein